MTDDAWEALHQFWSPLGDPTERVYLPFLLLSLAVTVALYRGDVRRAVRDLLWPGQRLGSLTLDGQMYLVRQSLRLMGVALDTGLSWAIALSLLQFLTEILGRHDAAYGQFGVVLFTMILFVLWDLSRYVVHRIMHEVPWLWAFHQVHHNAEAMTPLTFYRIHPVESLIYQARGIVVTGVTTGACAWWFGADITQMTFLGINAFVFGLHAFTGNLRHSHVALSFGTMERWFISPAMHQVHHGRTRSFQNSNYGTWLAVWDVIGGTWRSGTEAPEHFGLEPADRNHAPDDLVGALWRPVVDAGRHLTRSRLAPLSLLLLSPRGEAQDTVDASDDEEEAAYEVVVETTVEGIPRVAGSAHVVGQDELERFEQDDVHRILSRVPGVYLRDEDGFGLRPNIGLRGANSDRSGKVTLMEDGVLVAPAAYSAPAAYYFPMVTRMVGVEVFKGPSSIQFGPQTIGGAINLVTRAVPDGIRGEVDMSIGQRNAMKLHGWFGVGDASGGLLLEAVRLAHGGFKTVAVPPGTPELPTGFERHEFMAKALWKPVAEHQLSMKMAYSDEESFETYLGLSPVDFETDPYQRYAASAQDYMAWRRAMAQLAYDGAWSSAVQWRSVAYMSNLRRAWTKVNRMGVATPLADILRGDPDGQVGYYQAILAGRAESAGPEDQVWIGTNDRTYWTFGTQHGLSYRRQGDTWASRTDLGVRLHFDSIARLHDEAPWAMDGGLPRPTDGAEIITSNQTASALAFSAYVREDAQFGMLRLLPGIRVEAVETVIDDRLLGEERQALRAVPLPGLGVHLQPLTTLSVFGGLHRGFSPVSPTSPADTLPELSWNTELGTRWTPNRSRLELVGFFNAYENLTGQCTFAGGCSDQQLDQQFNAGNVWVWGLEALASHEVPIRGDMSLQLSGNYTWTGSRFLSAFRSAYPQFGDVEVGDRLPYVPEHQGMAQLVFLHPKFNLSLAATGRSFMRDEASQGAPDATASVPGSLVLDAAAHAILSPNVRAYVTAQNLTNQSWAASLRPFGVRPVMPLQVMFGLKVGADPQ